MQRTVIFGVETFYTLDVLECVERAGLEVAACVVHDPDIAVPDGLPNVVALDALTPDLLALPIVIPLLTPGRRKAALTQAQAAGFTACRDIVHPSAVVATSAEVGEGAVINAGAVVAAACVLGAQTAVNRNASVGHHVQAGDFVSFGPGSTICGRCHIERGSYIGGGATILPDVTLEANCVVGAGAVVTQDVPANTVAAGNPAKVIERGIAGYRDCGV